ncbi:MAG: hypothetical protein E7434_00380 [Ruminococcaceae bacterium]|nr:hypothetical protein [Oscillospiraceae bacterium]
MNWFSSILPKISQTLSSADSGVQSVLYATVYKLLYYISIGCCWIVEIFYSFFEHIAGLSQAAYHGDFDVLLSIFFSGGTVATICWSMAILGVVFALSLAIAALIRRASGDGKKKKRPIKEIFGSFGKAAVIMVSLCLVVAVLLNTTAILMQQINYAIDDETDKEGTIEFSDEDFAAMARVLNTIGNYSLNPSYDNRYNINSCFNEIRSDMQYLANRGVFNYRYVGQDSQGDAVSSWQAALQKIANAASLTQDLKLDVYYENVSSAIMETMELMRLNGTFKPLEKYERQYTTTHAGLSLDRALFLMATMHAAKNDDYNTAPSFADPLRSAYYYGEKSIYDLDAVNEDFDIGVAAIDFLVLLLVCWKLLKSLLRIIFHCAARIFDMLMLCLAASPIISRVYFDGEARSKHWVIAFVQQSLAMLAIVVLMRLLCMIVPIIFGAEMQLFAYPVVNALLKALVIVLLLWGAEKLSAKITAMLPENASYRAFQADGKSKKETGKTRKERIFIAWKTLLKGIWRLADNAINLAAFVAPNNENKMDAERTDILVGAHASATDHENSSVEVQ